MTDTNAISRFLNKPQELLKYIAETGDFEAGFDHINLVFELAKKFDDELDVILPGMEDLFEQLNPKDYSGMSFYEATIRRTPLSPVTIQRHTRVGRMLEAVPEEVRPAIENMNFKAKIQIANTLEDGYQLDTPQWQRLADVGYYEQEVALALHEIKGTQPRSQFCKFEVDTDGSIIANTAKGRITVYRPVDYDNPEIAELMEWVRGKAERKLGVTPRIGRR